PTRACSPSSCSTSGFFSFEDYKMFRIRFEQVLELLRYRLQVHRFKVDNLPLQVCRLKEVDTDLF
ncbi:unnamed protein product, partial [Amoebophrya sp. A120]